MATAITENAERRLRVAVAEDDEEQRAAFERALESEGFEVVSIEDGFELLDYFGLAMSRWVDAVVADVNMPGRSGLEGLALARRRGLSVPIFVVTGEPGEAVRDQVAQLGNARFFAKPVDPQLLAEEIYRAARGRP